MRTLANVLVFVGLVGCGGAAKSSSSSPASSAAYPPIVNTPPGAAPAPEPATSTPAEPDRVAYIDPDDGGEVADKSAEGGSDGGLQGIGGGSSPGTGAGAGIGTGHGSGQGAAGAPARRPGGPRVTIGKTTVGKGLAQEIVRRVVMSRVGVVRFCYEKQLTVDPAIAGLLVAKLAIGGDGKVVSATATGVDPSVASCIATRMQTWEFPKPTKAPVNVTQPYNFAPY
ncbi:MAG: AgmX/PglI C-terminal domain-containing protein [Myxococcales bacterium]|nr:AgmX/PglI C-terminal domain-containing protein [Myxococcales bacterium]